MQAARRTSRHAARCLTPFSVALSVLAGVPAFGAGAPVGLFVSDPAASAGQRSQEIARAIADTPAHRSATLGFLSERLDLDAVGAGDEWSLALFDDVTLPVLVQGVSRVGGAVTASGRVMSEDGAVAVGDFVASVVGDAMSMAAWLDDGRVFEVRPGPGGVGLAFELDSPSFPGCAVGAEHAVHAEDHKAVRGVSTRGACSDDGSELSVLIVYTPSARNASGGTNGITSLANSAVASANTAYVNSHIATRLNLVHVAEVDFSESSMSTDLARLRSTSDGFADEVHALRDQYQADFVAMIGTQSGACGIGYLMTNLSTGFQSSAFTVTNYSCAVGNLSFAHEVGHNMGCTHDRDNANGGLFSYSFGHRWISTDNNRQYRSVMSYSPGSRIPYFSNPDVSYRGTPTGVAAGQPGSAFNALSITNALSTVAQFRSSGSAPEIVGSPQAAEVEAGSVAVISVQVLGEDLSFNWFRDGVLLFDDGRVTGSGSASLRIADVTPSDAGAYSVAILNGCGGVVSDPATLDVVVSCPADVSGDGELNFFDVSSFIALYNAQDPVADVAEPFGAFNFFDVSAFVAAYNAGCP